jgi:hypothetical protein
MTVLVRKKDLEAYLNGGASPMRGHYIYISWHPREKMQSSIQADAEMKRVTGNYPSFLEAIKTDEDYKIFIETSLRDVAMVPLGILRNWGDGYIAGNAVRFELMVEGKPIRSAKILSAAYQQRSNGYYEVNCVTLQEYGEKLQAALEMTKAIAQSLKNMPA